MVIIDNDHYSIKPEQAETNEKTNKNYQLTSHINPVIKQLIQNRKFFDPSWTRAAESVFSESHPFKAADQRRNKSQEPPRTQNKEQVTARSHSESRCQKLAGAANEDAKSLAQKDTSEKLGDVGQQTQISSSSDSSKKVKVCTYGK